MATMNQWYALVLLLATSWQASSQELECTSKVFTQETAPQRLSDIHRSLTEEVNRERTGEEMKLEVEWKGDFKDRKPGHYIIDAKLGGRPRCYRYIIEDVNECSAHQTNEAGTDWYHQCHKSTECQNKNGTYECMCPYIESIGRRATALASTKWPCEGKTNSEECCTSSDGDLLTHSACKRDFKCHEKMCNKKTECDRSATCTDHYNASGYSCTCQEGLIGNGKACTNADTKYSVMADPKKLNSYSFLSLMDGSQEHDVSKVCGCNKPVLKGKCKNSMCCDGKSPCNEECSLDGVGCVCKHDFTNITNEDDPKGWSCVDETPPIVRLLDDKGEFIDDSLTQHVVDVKQCDHYEDYGYDIEDDNKDRNLRKFEMVGNVPSGCLKELKQYNLTFKTWIGPDDHPWSQHQITRIINVQDIDECQLTKKTAACPSCIPQCEEEATCLNQIGSYTCKCPVCGAYGDGFKHISDPLLRPVGYVNGSGCQDSCAPKITLLGDPVKVFKVCTCSGPLCPSSAPSNLLTPSSSLNKNDEDYYLKWEPNLIQALKDSPDEFCSNGLKFPCAEAKDLTMNGRKTVDISSRIHVGQPFHVGPGLVWNIPYSVSDEAGNKAQTVFKEVRVKEMTFEEIEQEALQKKHKGSGSAVVAASNPPTHTCPMQAAPNCNCKEEVARAVSVAKGKTTSSSLSTTTTAIHNGCNITGLESYAFPVMLFVLVCLLLAVLCCICVLRDENGSGSQKSQSQLQSLQYVPRRFPNSDTDASGSLQSPGNRLVSPSSLASRNSSQTPTTPGVRSGFNYGTPGSSNQANTPNSSRQDSNDASRSGGQFGMRSPPGSNQSNAPFSPQYR